MAKILYLEGVDKVGKTTFANQLSKDLDVPVVHFGVPPTTNTYQFYLQGLNKAAAENPEGFILDRFFFSNFVYSGVFGGGLLKPEEFVNLHKEFVKHEVYHVLLVAHPDGILRRISADEDKAGSLSRNAITRMQSQFLELSRSAPFRKRWITEYGLLFAMSHDDAGEPLGYVTTGVYWQIHDAFQKGPQVAAEDES